MKNILFFPAIMFLFFISCNKSSTAPIEGAFKARFEIAGVCMNYTFSVIEGDIDPALVEKSWTDPNTGKTYSNAFGLAELCGRQGFENIKEGDTFYFEITKPSPKPCGTCGAYYPTPQKKLSIKVLQP